jgi:hypothetical protein
MARSRLYVASVLALSLAGCAGGEKIKASPTFVCVELKQYSRAEQNRMADELEAHADQIPAIAAAIDDYGSLRAAIRKVCKRNPG